MAQCTECGQRDSRGWVFCPICGSPKKTLIDKRGVCASFTRLLLALIFFVIGPIVLFWGFLGCIRMLVV
jgi:hypothetical protein